MSFHALFIAAFGYSCFLYAQDAELVVASGHALSVNAVALSPDETTLASGSDDRTIKLWDMKTGFEIRTLCKDMYVIHTLAFSPDGSMLASGGDDIRLWNAKSGNTLRQINITPFCHSLAFSPDGSMLAAACGDYAISIWNPASGAIIRTLRSHTGFINQIAFSPDGTLLASASDDKTVIIWDVRHGAVIKILKEHSSTVNAVAFSADGAWLASGSMDQTVRIWETHSGKCKKTFKNHTYGASTVTFIPDSDLLLVGSGRRLMLGEKTKIYCWDIKKEKLLYSWDAHVNMITALRLNQNSSILISSGRDAAIRFWDRVAGKLIWSFTSYSRSVYSSDVSVDDVLAMTSDKRVLLWDMKTGVHIKRTEECDQWLRSVRFQPSGRRIGGNAGKKIYVWNTGEDNPFRILEPAETMTDAFRSFAFHPLGAKLAAGSTTGKICVWDIAANSQIIRFDASSSPITSLCYTGGGEMLLAASFKNITFHDTLTGKWKRFSHDAPHAGEVNSMVISHDGKMIVSAGDDGHVKLWDIFSYHDLWYYESPVHKPELSKLLLQLSGSNGPVNTVSVSGSAKYIASAGKDPLIRLWDAQNGSLLRTFKGHNDRVTSLSFAANDRLVVSSGWDGRVILWDRDSGQRVLDIFDFGDGEYLLKTPDHYYTASRGALKRVGVRVSDKIFPFEQFDLRLNRPDIIADRIGLAPKELVASYHAAYRRRLRKMRFSEDMLSGDIHLPEISVTTTGLPVSTDQSALTVHVKAGDSKYLLDRLNLFINDVPIYGSDGISLRNNKSSFYEQDIALELSTGYNKVQVSVLNEKGVESLREMFIINYDGPPVQPDLYILAIGISDYADDEMDLRYAAKDACDLAGLFQKNAVRYYHTIHILKLLDRDAVKANILKAKSFFTPSKPDDQVIVFIAGHGVLDDQMNWYFAPSDIDFSHPSAKGISYDELEGLLDGIPARKKLLLMDACHSGEVDREEHVLVAGDNTGSGSVKSRSFKKRVEKKQQLGLENTYELMQTLFADLSRGSGAMVIASAGGAEYAWESAEWKNGVFTYALLDGLKSKRADKNNDGQISLSELRDYTANKVQSLTKGRQHPASRKENLEFDFRIW